MQVDEAQQESDNEMPPLEDVEPQQDGLRGPGIDDMVPAIRDLSNATVSLSSATDIHMPAADSVLGKRTADEEVQGGQLDLTLALNSANKERGMQKKGRVGYPIMQGKNQVGSRRGQNQQDEQEVEEAGKKKAATGHGASGEEEGSNELHHVQLSGSREYLESA